MWCDCYLKAVLPCRDVDSSQVNHVPELGVGVVPQESQHRDHSVRMDHHLQLIVTGHLHKNSFSNHLHVSEI